MDSRVGTNLFSRSPCFYFPHRQMADRKIWREIYRQKDHHELGLCEPFHRLRPFTKP